MNDTVCTPVRKAGKTSSTTTPPKVDAGKQLSLIDRGDLVQEATMIANAIEWMVIANDLIERIRFEAQIRPAFAQQLLDWGIAYNSPDWAESNMAAFLGCLLVQQMELINQLGGMES